jgi:hypothetical protein
MRRALVTSTLGALIALVMSGVSDAVVPLTIKPAQIGRTTTISISFIQPRRLPRGYRFIFGFLTASDPDRHASIGDCTAVKVVQSARRGTPHKRFYMVIRPLSRFGARVITRWCWGPATVSVGVARIGASEARYAVGSRGINVGLPSF